MKRIGWRRPDAKGGFERRCAQMIPGNDTGTTAHRRSADGDSILPHGNSEMRLEREESPPRENGGGEPKYACESFGSLQQNSDASETGAEAPSPPFVARGPSRRALTPIRSKERPRALSEGPDEVGVLKPVFRARWIQPTSPWRACSIRLCSRTPADSAARPRAVLLAGRGFPARASARS